VGALRRVPWPPPCGSRPRRRACPLPSRAAAAARKEEGAHGPALRGHALVQDGELHHEEQDEVGQERHRERDLGKPEGQHAGDHGQEHQTHPAHHPAQHRAHEGVRGAPGGPENEAVGGEGVGGGEGPPGERRPPRPRIEATKAERPRETERPRRPPARSPRISEVTVNPDGFQNGTSPPRPSFPGHKKIGCAELPSNQQPSPRPTRTAPEPVPIPRYGATSRGSFPVPVLPFCPLASERNPRPDNSRETITAEGGRQGTLSTLSH
jgi:hypothetical protein